MIIRLTTLFAFLKPSMRRPSDPRRLVGRGQDAWANGRLWKTAGFLHAFPSDWRLSGHVDHRWLVWKINVYIASVVRDYDDIMTLLVCIQLCWKSWRSCVFACNESSKKNNAGRSDWPRVAIALGHGIRSDVDVYRSMRNDAVWVVMLSHFGHIANHHRRVLYQYHWISCNILRHFKRQKRPLDAVAYPCGGAMISCFPAGKLRVLTGSYTWSFYVFILMAFLACCHYAALELGKKKTLQARIFRSMPSPSRMHCLNLMLCLLYVGNVPDGKHQPGHSKNIRHVFV